MKRAPWRLPTLPRNFPRILSIVHSALRILSIVHSAPRILPNVHSAADRRRRRTRLSEGVGLALEVTDSLVTLKPQSDQRYSSSSTGPAKSSKVLQTEDEEQLRRGCCPNRSGQINWDFRQNTKKNDARKARKTLPASTKTPPTHWKRTGVSCTDIPIPVDALGLQFLHKHFNPCTAISIREQTFHSLNRPFNHVSTFADKEQRTKNKLSARVSNKTQTSALCRTLTPPLSMLAFQT